MRRLSTFLVALALVVGACSKDESTSPPPPQEVGSLSGVVTDLDGDPIGSALVTARGDTTYTNEQGWFTFPEVRAGSLLLSVSKQGYHTLHRPATVRRGVTTHMPQLALVRVHQATVSAPQGGTVSTPDGIGAATFPAGAFSLPNGQLYTGAAEVAIAAVTPDEPRYQDCFPGSFEGITRGGTTVPFVSFGFMGVEVTAEGGTRLQLASGASAQLALRIPSTLLHAAPDTMPLWLLDEATGQWREQGFAVRQGDRYVGSVSHLSTWNWDYPITDICQVTGRVVREDGNPVADARVISQGVTVSYRDETFSDAAGRFTVRALKNSTVDVWALKGTFASQSQRVQVGQSCPVELPSPLVLREPAFSITLRWGEDPSDLDSHLYIPMTWDPNWDLYHIAYYQMGELNTDPYTTLDTDDTDSFGPEIISGFKLYTGRYAYFVHHFSGSGTIKSSPALVHLSVGSQSRSYSAAQASGQVGDWWHVFDLAVSASGSVSIADVNRFEAPSFPGQRVFEGGWARPLTDLPRK